MKYLNDPLGKRILLILIAGLIIIVADYIMSVSDNNSVFRDKEGNVLILRPDEGDDPNHVLLKATVKDGKDTYEKEYELSIEPYSRNEKKSDDDSSYDEKKTKVPDDEIIAYELRSAISEVNDDISVRKVRLPSSLPSGENIYWSTKRKTNTVPLLFIIFVTCFLLYRNRLSPIKKLKKAQSDSIARQLPEFINKLVLLLNVGLVLTTAFEMSVEESLDSNKADEDYFYGKMRDIYLSMKETNSSLNSGFRAFAKESGDNGLMRISNILSDNISKGVELTEKLQLEGEVLWLNRKRNCEERGRLSETRLTLPLTLFLLVLIIITVSPALLEL